MTENNENNHDEDIKKISEMVNKDIESQYMQILKEKQDLEINCSTLNNINQSQSEEIVKLRKDNIEYKKEINQLKEDKSKLEAIKQNQDAQIVESEKKIVLLKQLKIKQEDSLSQSNGEKEMYHRLYEDQLNQMDQTILQIKKDIEMSIIKYDNIMIDIKNLFEESRKILTNDFNANDDDSEDDFSKVVNLGNPTSEVNALMEKKKLLEIEINDLKEKYNSQKASIQKKESILKQKVTKLSRQYINNKQVISVQTKMLIPKQEYNIEKKVSSLINHIDSTILELRSTYA